MTEQATNEAETTPAFWDEVSRLMDEQGIGGLEDLRRRLTPAAADKTAKRAMDRASAHGYAGPDFTGEQWLALVEASGGRCLRCGEADPTVDHVIPLASGGPNTIENVQVLCASCNSEKGGEKTDYR